MYKVLNPILISTLNLPLLKSKGIYILYIKLCKLSDNYFCQVKKVNMH